MLKNQKEDWDGSFTNEDYIARVVLGVKYLHFLCPGCGHLIGVKHPGWELVDLDTLTVSASILHTKPDGCGWHGYLTNGVLEGQIE